MTIPSDTVYIGPMPVDKKPLPMVLQWESWQAKLVRKAEILHALGKPCIMVVTLGDHVPTCFKTELLR